MCARALLRSCVRAYACVCVRACVCARTCAWPRALACCRVCACVWQAIHVFISGQSIGGFESLQATFRTPGTFQQPAQLRAGHHVITFAFYGSCLAWVVCTVALIILNVFKKRLGTLAAGDVHPPR